MRDQVACSGVQPKTVAIHKATTATMSLLTTEILLEIPLFTTSSNVIS